MTTLPARGEVWWCEMAEIGRRPVVVLSRDAVIPRHRRALVAPCTTTIRGLVSEVGLAPAGAGTAVPGFVDAHINGYAGVDFLRTDLEGYRRARAALAATGVVALQLSIAGSDLPILVTDKDFSAKLSAERLDPIETLRTPVDAIEAIRRDGRYGELLPRQIKATGDWLASAAWPRAVTARWLLPRRSCAVPSPSRASALWA